MKLNPNQQLAIDHLDGNILIVAGAGSGKTRVLTERIVKLVDINNVSPSEIVAITFTNKAAKEMKERIEKRLGDRAHGMYISTFHSLCIEILKEGHPDGFYTLSEADQISQIHAHMAQLNICTRSFNPRNVLKYISEIKNGNEIKEGIYKTVATDVLDLYTSHMKAYKSFDYDDLITETLSLLKTNTVIRQKYQQLFRYIHVDEYQDTNPMQYELIKILSNFHGNLCVVGDPDQSIYRFRGADITIILNFDLHFQNAKKIILEQNYRSSNTIVNASNYVISKNKYRIEKNVFTDNLDDSMITHYAADDEIDEAEYIARCILLQQNEGIPFSEMVILYRSHRLAYYIKEKLDIYEIPYKVVEKTSISDQEEIKLILDLIKFSLNPQNMLLQQDLMARLDEKWDTYHNEVRSNLNLKDIVGTITTVASFIECSQRQMIVELLHSVQAFETFEDFFMQVPKDIEKIEEFKENRVTFMTIHGSKGLEFDCVFMVGMEEGTFPSKRSFDDFMDLEEERRLCYVGMTRARKTLYMTRAKTRDKCAMHPSRFLYDIPEEYMHANELPDRRVYIINSIGIFEKGDLVRHSKWGEGEIQSIYKAGDHVVFDVVFKQVGSKKLIAYSAILEKVV